MGDSDPNECDCDYKYCSHHYKAERNKRDFIYIILGLAILGVASFYF